MSIRAWARTLWQWTRRRAAGYLLAVALVALITATLAAIPARFLLGHRAPLYLISVLATGAISGRGPAILASLLSFLAFDWFFVPPFHTLTVSDPEEWQALLLLLLTALVTGQLTALLRDRAATANRREQEALALYEIGQALASAASTDQVLAAATDRLRLALGLTACAVLLPDGGRLRPLSGAALRGDDEATAQWVFAHGTPAARGWGWGTHRLVRIRRDREAKMPSAPRTSDASAGAGQPSGTSGATFLPLIVDQKMVGVLYALSGAGKSRFPPGETRLLAAAADQLALAVERGRLQQESVRAEVLKRTDELRVALLSSVSHDLRTPLAAIKAAAGSLLQREVSWDDASRLAFAAQIEREADRLNRLVGNLLDLSRIEAGALVLDRQWYPLAELVDDTVARLRPALAGHHVDTAIPVDLPPVYLDYVLIQQVLANLLENAARYTPPGTPIRVSAAPAGQTVRVRVEDEGPGLPESERQRIFQPFFRVEAADRRPAGPSGPPGTGLGLAVSAGFVAAHGGRIWVEPAERPLSGAAFSFELPAVPPPAPHRASGAPSADHPVGARLDQVATPPHAAEVFRPPRSRRKVMRPRPEPPASAPQETPGKGNTVQTSTVRT
ncbi:MAG: sensor histidine kinase [Chloroflexota bacterium]